jgi:hypothetical protein
MRMSTTMQAEWLGKLDPEVAGAIASAYQARARRIAQDPAFARLEPRRPAPRPRPALRRQEGPVDPVTAHHWDQRVAFHLGRNVGIAEAPEIKALWERVFQFRYMRQDDALDFYALAALRMSRMEWIDVFTRAESASDHFRYRDAAKASLAQAGRPAPGPGDPVPEAAKDFVPRSLIESCARAIQKRRRRRDWQATQLAYWRARGDVPSAERCRAIARVQRRTHSETDGD